LNDLSLHINILSGVGLGEYLLPEIGEDFAYSTRLGVLWVGHYGMRVLLKLPAIVWFLSDLDISGLGEYLFKFLYCCIGEIERDLDLSRTLLVNSALILLV